MSLPVRLLCITVILMAFSFFEIGCTTTQYVYKQPIKKLDNGMTQYDDPKIEKNLTGYGYVGSVLGSGIGGVAGYYSNLSVDHKIDKTTNTICGALLGGLVSAAVIIISDNGLPTRINEDNYKQWIQAVNRHSEYVSSKMNDSNMITSIVLIRSDADSSFHVKSIEDAKIFARCFPNSRYSSRVAQEASLGLKRQDLLEMTSIFPDSTQSMIVKRAYAERSSSINECMRVKTQYPEVGSSATSRAFFLFNQISVWEMKDTIKRYPFLTEQGDERMFSAVKDESGFKAYLSMFPNGKHVTSAKRSLDSTIVLDIENSTSIFDLQKIAEDSPHLNNLVEHRAAEIAIETRYYDDYLRLFPNGVSANRINALQEGRVKSIRAQVDQDLPVFKAVVLEINETQIG